MEDFNNLGGIRKQMGSSFQNEMKRKLPNSTKCSTWNEVEQSHTMEDPRVVVQLEDIYGMMILLAVGLSGAVVVLTMELLNKILIRKHNQIYLASGKLYLLNAEIMRL